ncbi:nicotinate phosphoribosyltransferase [Candidatus Protochlamydia sp. W-9]|uniref:nicotinate phosphoribosyltransferase n=1 Tax=Candidatus Protochlamydia sp. W-9 TaxID=1785087 RepID=UPI00096A9EAB|nr:nicotinate phosphoribosyltransferase [Candidatus Protochlamydia sp. W-9]
MQKNAPIFNYYKQSIPILTDFYQLTMAYSFWKTKLQNQEAVFHLFFRKSPFQGGFTIAAGLEYVIDLLDNFHFDPSDLAYLEQMRNSNNEIYFSSEFLDYLSKLRFSGNIDAMPEGTVVFPYEPLLRIQGPLIECQLLESIFLNLINFSSLIATKSARINIAAGGEPVFEFGLRRAQGIDGSLIASRAAYIGGCQGTSNVAAGRIFGIPLIGTQAHSWIMIFDEELDAFQEYARVLPDNCIFLVDTYNTLEGVKKAIQVGNWLKSQGKKMLGIRLDSGDLADLSIKCRSLLDQEGFTDTKIIASNDLDEDIISELKRQNAQITNWGVGTSLVTGKNQSALDGVYKLSAIRNLGDKWRYKLKLSEQMMKVSNPGILQVRRYYSDIGNIGDVIYDIDQVPTEYCRIVDCSDFTKQKILKKGLFSRDLLQPIFRSGKRIYEQPSLNEIRQTTQRELSGFSNEVKKILNPHLYEVGIEESLHNLKMNLIKNIRDRTLK